jgi:hypothetical protein|tara:strand:+ start:713 stop:1144 length:432 start_codon:yes stop_codon:yes gene_type:complete
MKRGGSGFLFFCVVQFPVFDVNLCSKKKGNYIIMSIKRVDWTQDEIKEMLKQNDRAVIKALIAIWKYQTVAEQGCSESHEHNNVGFTGIDAEICTSLVNFYNDRGFLTPKQMTIARKKSLKYTRQLKAIANKEYDTQMFINKL